MNIHKSMGLLHLSYHRYILVNETKQIQTSSLTFCAFDIELFNYISLSHRKSLYFIFFLSLDKCVLVPLLEDHIICDCAGILQEKRSTFKLQFTISTREEKNALPTYEC